MPDLPLGFMRESRLREGEHPVREQRYLRGLHEQRDLQGQRDLPVPGWIHRKPLPDSGGSL
jgi:hypothetical protein